MDRMTRRVRRGGRTSRKTKILAVCATVVLFGGLFAQIAVRAQLSGQAKQIAAVEREIHTMDANCQNLNLYINQYHNLIEIGQRAQVLGMQQPEEGQLRVVSLPVAGNTSAQTVANSDGMEIAG